MANEHTLTYPMVFAIVGTIAAATAGFVVSKVQERDRVNEVVQRYVDRQFCLTVSGDGRFTRPEIAAKITECFSNGLLSDADRPTLLVETDRWLADRRRIMGF